MENFEKSNQNCNQLLQNNILLKLINCDNVNTDDLKALVEGMENEMNRKEILSKHSTPINQLPSGKWYTRINGRKIERKNKADLEDIIVKYYSQKERTLSSIFNEYLDRRKIDVADTTWQKDIRYYEYFIRDCAIANIPLERLTLNDGYSFLEHCLKVKPDMTRKYWVNVSSCVNQIFQYAINQGIIKRNPFEKMKPKKDLFAPPAQTRDGDTVFSRSEQSKVCELAEEDAQKTKTSIPLGIIILFNIGIRISELCALKWGDIEERCKMSRIHIQREMVANVNNNGMAHGFKVLPHCKTPAGDRRLQLNAKAIYTFNKIKEYNESNGIPTSANDYIFLRWDKNKLLNCTPRSFDSRLRKYCKQADMDVIKSPHDVRRTVLTNLYMAGMPLKEIQRYAGHSTLKQTLDYIRISDDDLNLLQFLNTLSEEGSDTVVPFRKKETNHNIVGI